VQNVIITVGYSIGNLVI